MTLPPHHRHLHYLKFLDIGDPCVKVTVIQLQSLQLSQCVAFFVFAVNVNGLGVVRGRGGRSFAILKQAGLPRDVLRWETPERTMWCNLIDLQKNDKTSVLTRNHNKTSYPIMMYIFSEASLLDKVDLQNILL